MVVFPFRASIYTAIYSSILHLKWDVMSRLNIFIIMLLFLFTACNESEQINIAEEFSEYENLSIFPTDTEPEFEIILERQTVYGDTEDVLLGNWLTAVVDNRDRVFVADYQETALHLYNPDGTYNRQIGQEGEGPGEYRSLSTMRTDNQCLHLMDRNLNRVTRYSLDTFEVTGSVAISMDPPEDGPYMYPVTFFVHTDSTYLLQTGMGYTQGKDESGIERTIGGRIMNNDTGELSDSAIFSFPAPEALVYRENGGLMIMTTVPYLRSSIFRVRNDQVIHGGGDDFLFTIYNKDGEYQRAIYYPYPNPPLVRDDILAQYSDDEEQLKSIIRNVDMPDTLPVFSSFYVDDEGRIWVKKMTDDFEEAEYAVLANSGELLATFTWPAGNIVQEIRNGHLYTMETNEETGLREIVKYKFDFGEK